MAPSGPAPAMVENDTSLSRPVSRRKLSSASTIPISVSLPRGASRSNQARKRVTAAPSRRCAARAPSISTWFFTALSSAIGSGPLLTVPPRLPTRRASASAPVAWSSRTVLPASPSAARSRAKCVGRAHVGKFFQAVAHVVGKLAPVDIERRPALARDHREGQRQRGVRHVRAADVEGPGDRVRIGHHQRVGLELCDLGADQREFCLPRRRRRSAESCSLTGPSGGAGRSLHNSSIGLGSIATSVAPALAQALASFSAPSTVCSHGS